LEKGFREYSQELAKSNEEKQFLSCDGKVLRGSFDHFNDQKAIQLLSAFANDSHLILAHEEIAAKTATDLSWDKISSSLFGGTCA
jgi:hypothetical protein